MAQLFDKITALWCLLGAIVVLTCSYAVQASGAVDVGLLMALVMIAWLCYTLASRKSKRWGVWLFAGSFCLFIALVLIFNTPQISDFQLRIDTAREYLAGNRGAFHVFFFEEWPDTLGFSALEVALLSICDRIMFLKAVEALFSSGSLVLAYSLMCVVSSERTARTISALLALFPMFALASSMVTDQVISAFFSLAAIRVLLWVSPRMSFGQTVASVCACGVLIGVSRFIRPDALLVFLAAAVYVICASGALGKPNANAAANGVLRRLALILALTASCWMVGALGSCVLGATGIASPESTSDHVTVNKVVMGTNPDNNGGWNGEFRDEIKEKMENQGLSYSAAGMELVREQVPDLQAAAALVIGKAQRLWWGDANSFSLYAAPGIVSSWAYQQDKLLVSVLLLGLFAASVGFFRGKGEGVVRDAVRLLLVIVALTIGAYLFIEVQPRYLYFAYIVLFVLLAYAVESARVFAGKLGEVLKRSALCGSRE